MDDVPAARALDWPAAALRPITRDRIDAFDVCCPSPEPGTNWSDPPGSPTRPFEWAGTRERYRF